MPYPLEDEFFIAAIYVFGFVGLFGIGLLPIRCWYLIRSLSAQKGFLIAASIVASAFGAIDIIAVYHTFTCLTEVGCGPGIATGWLYLSVFGVTYAVFELLSYGLGVLARAMALRNRA